MSSDENTCNKWMLTNAVRNFRTSCPIAVRSGMQSIDPKSVGVRAHHPVKVAKFIKYKTNQKCPCLASDNRSDRCMSL